MKKMICANVRKMTDAMRTFIRIASQDKTAGIKKDICCCAYISQPKIKIGYNIDQLFNSSQKQFRADFVSRHPSARGFADITIVLLHEIGHYKTCHNDFGDYNRELTILQLRRKYSRDTINFEYFKLPDEMAATKWAIDWLSMPENRKAAKKFEKKFFASFKKIT